MWRVQLKAFSNQLTESNTEKVSRELITNRTISKTSFHLVFLSFMMLQFQLSRSVELCFMVLFNKLPIWMQGELVPT